jgi:hypothetical protein
MLFLEIQIFLCQSGKPRKRWFQKIHPWLRWSPR